MAIKYNAAGKIIAHRFKLARLQRASEKYQGFCRACGAKRDNCEPDARKYNCESCGKDHVYGAEELVLMGAVSDC